MSGPPAPGRPASAPSGAPAGAAAPPMKRQYVNFAFFKVDESFRALPEAQRQAAKRSLDQAAETFRKDGILLCYAMTGFRSDVDFMLWRISYDADAIQNNTGALNRSALGPWLRMPSSFLAMTKRSVYIDKHSHPGQDGNRLNIYPGNNGKYLFIYPFLKTREWYLLSKEERQEMMDEHIRVGNQYPSVRLNTTYSFGLDDQDFVVAFESDLPEDFLDLVMALRETKASKYTLRDTPFRMGKQCSITEALDLLG